MAQRPADYYTVLGVRRDATLPELKRAYRTLAHECHPDKPENQGSADAEARFKAIAEAYAVLADPDQRKRYDRGEDVVMIGAGAAQEVVRRVVDELVFRQLRRRMPRSARGEGSS